MCVLVVLWVHPDWLSDFYASELQGLKKANRYNIGNITEIPLHQWYVIGDPHILHLILQSFCRGLKKPSYYLYMIVVTRQ